MAESIDDKYSKLAELEEEYANGAIDFHTYDYRKAQTEREIMDMKKEMGMDDGTIMTPEVTEAQSAAAASNSRGVISEKMAQVGEAISQVINGLTDDPIYATFLRFKVNDLVIDTNSQDPSQSLLMSFELQKNGSGYANAFTVRIAYCPDEELGLDCNTIEDAMLRVIEADGASSTDRYCELSYGYCCIGGEKLESPTYKGMVIDYECEIQDGMLAYVITGYSSLSQWKEQKSSLKLDMPSKCKPTAAAKTLIEKYLSSYKCEFDTDVEGSDCEISFSDPVDKNPARALTEILESAVHESQAEYLKGVAIEEDKLITYEWFVSDVPDGEYEGTIYITMSIPDQDAKDPKADANIVFDWMGNNSGNNSFGIVLDFKPQYKGSVRLSIAAELYGSDSQGGVATGTTAETTFTFIDDDGNQQTIFPSNSPATGGIMEMVVANLKREKSSWLHDAQYPYKATMTTMGIPRDIPVTGRINIVPLILGKKHHSHGIYQVTSTTDQIDGGGQYTTYWELMKLTPAKDYRSKWTAGTASDNLPSKTMSEEEYVAKMNEWSAGIGGGVNE